MVLDPGEVVTQTDIDAYPVRRGKVRDIYDMGSEILLIATDRISAYDVILPTPNPGKGVLLTRISQFWFNFFADTVPHHLIEVVDEKAPPGLDDKLAMLRGRTMRCRKTEVVPIEFVVRGYLAGSGWKDYQRTGAVCGIELPAGMKQCQKLAEPIFTPATKAQTGHDENISFEQACESIPEADLTFLRDRSITIYNKAAEHALARGLLIADTTRSQELDHRAGPFPRSDEPHVRCVGCEGSLQRRFVVMPLGGHHDETPAVDLKPAEVEARHEAGHTRVIARVASVINPGGAPSELLCQTSKGVNSR